MKIGEKYNRLTIKKDLGRYKRNRIVLVECDCGNIKKVILDNILKNRTKSCGCLRREQAKKRWYKHGFSYSRFYKIYKSIPLRCDSRERKTVENWRNYGGRGIRCQWKSFLEFKKDMYRSYLAHVRKYGIKNTTIDRINNNKNYYKENCKWSTLLEQNNNKRNTRFIEYKGKIKTLKEWSDILGIQYSTLHKKLSLSSWPVGKIFKLKSNESLSPSTAIN